MKTIKIDSTNGYLNLNYLPTNCIFNKKITGCGGTSIALFGETPYVIAVPTTELITNKTGLQYAGASTIKMGNKTARVFGVFGDKSWKSEFKKFLALNGTKQIMCTYDKLEAVSEVIKAENWHLLVDEYQILLKAYSYRSHAINGVFKSFRKFASFCFMSATPISAEFVPSPLNGVQIIEAEWEQTDSVKVILSETNKPFQKAANIINSFVADNGVKFGGVVVKELFFFINSVTDIANILAHCYLTNEDVRVICADNESNRTKLKGFDISNSKSANKPINFITSKSFEGADYFSDCGLSIVVSSASSKNTMLDISTDVYQIAGRIRTAENPFRNTLVHIYNTTNTTNKLTFEEMLNRVNKNIEYSNKVIDIINEDPDAGEYMAKNLVNDKYIYKEGNKYYLNDTLIKLELFNYRIEQQIYSSDIAIAKTYAKSRVEVNEMEAELDLENSIKDITTKLTFKEAFNEYARIKNNKFDMSNTSYLVKAQPLIVKAYELLGEDRVKSLRYVKKNIEAELLNLDNTKTLDNKIARLLSKRIICGFMSSKDIKDIFADIYESLNINKKATATQIEKYYDCKEARRRIEGSQVRGYDIYRSNIIWNNLEN